MNEQKIPETALARIGEPSASVISMAMKLPPRDLIKFEKDITAVVQSSPEIAESCIYFRPVGKKNGKQQLASGVSVRLAEIGQQAYGRLWVNGNVDEFPATVEANVACFDLGTLNITYGRCSKSIVGRNGKYPLSVIETTKAAALSIARREALAQQMRPQLEKAKMEARKIAIKQWSAKGDCTEAYNALFADFSKRWKTDTKQFKAVAETETNKEAQIMLLIGIRNYLIDNPEEYSSVFGGSSPKSGIEPNQEAAPAQTTIIPPATKEQQAEFMARQTSGKSPKTKVQAPPPKDKDNELKLDLKPEEPTKNEEFELTIQSMAEAAGKTFEWAKAELLTAFKVDSLEKIESQIEAIKYLYEIL
jgi:hypothetical protein